MAENYTHLVFGEQKYKEVLSFFIFIFFIIFSLPVYSAERSVQTIRYYFLISESGDEKELRCSPDGEQSEGLGCCEGLRHCDDGVCRRCCPVKCGKNEYEAIDSDGCPYCEECEDAKTGLRCPIYSGTDSNGCPMYREKTKNDCPYPDVQELEGCECVINCPELMVPNEDNTACQCQEGYHLDENGNCSLICTKNSDTCAQNEDCCSGYCSEGVCQASPCPDGYEIRTYKLPNISGGTLRGYGNEYLIFQVGEDKKTIELRQKSSCWYSGMASWRPVLAIYPIPGDLVEMSLTLSATGDPNWPGDHPTFKDNEPFTISCKGSNCYTEFQYYFDGCNGSAVHKVNFKNLEMNITYCALKDSQEIKSISCSDVGLIDDTVLQFGGCRRPDTAKTCSSFSDCCFKDIGSGLYNLELEYTSLKGKYYYDMYHCQYWGGGYSSDIYSCFLCFY